MATTAEPNIEVEDVGRTLLGLYQDKLLVPPDVHAVAHCLLADALAVMVERMRYSELGKTPLKCKSLHLVSLPIKPSLE